MAMSEHVTYSSISSHKDHSALVKEEVPCFVTMIDYNFFSFFFFSQILKPCLRNH